MKDGENLPMSNEPSQTVTEMMKFILDRGTKLTQFELELLRNIYQHDSKNADNSIGIILRRLAELERKELEHKDVMVKLLGAYWNMAGCTMPPALTPKKLNEEWSHILKEVSLNTKFIVERREPQRRMDFANLSDHFHHVFDGREDLKAFTHTLGGAFREQSDLLLVTRAFIVRLICHKVLLDSELLLEGQHSSFLAKHYQLLSKIGKLLYP